MRDGHLPKETATHSRTTAPLLAKLATRPPVPQMDSITIVHAINKFLSVDTPNSSGHVIVTALQTGFRLETELFAMYESGSMESGYYTQMSDVIAVKLGEMSATMRARKTHKRVRNMRRAMVAAGVRNVRVM